MFRLATSRRCPKEARSWPGSANAAGSFSVPRQWVGQWAEVAFCWARRRPSPSPPTRPTRRRSRRRCGPSAGQGHPSRPGRLGARSAGDRLERAGRRPLVGREPHEAGPRRRDDGAGRLRADRRADGRQGLGQAVPPPEQGARQGRRRLPARREDRHQAELGRHDLARRDRRSRDLHASSSGRTT